MILNVKTSVGDYNIVIERGSINRLNEHLSLQRNVLIVTDDGVPKEYSQAVAAQSKSSVTVTLPQGEQSKSLESYEKLLSVMVEHGFTRSDCVVAVGGGVMGDLAGFVAASYMRGVDFYNIPTTVLSQVDSSIGGKVAINFKGYKNIVGAFYPPRAVIIDADTLNTLPERQIANGLAESVKMALTCDKELFEYLELGEWDIEKIIEASLKIKRDVVEQDEKEAGLRKVLNFGHTLAHAIESENIGNLYHGECVALGMLPMCSSNVRGRLVELLRKIGLPTEISYSSEKIISAVGHDKKMTGDKLTVIYVPEIGHFEMKNINLEIFKEVIEK